jgi:two-component system, NarL family, nitrate/nitrite response regulator NarL
MSKNGNNADSSDCISTAGTLRNSVGHFATLVISDNALVRAGLTHILSGTQFTVVDASEAAPALCLVDASGSSERALETVTSIKSQHPLCKIALIESQGEIGLVQAAISEVARFV